MTENEKKRAAKAFSDYWKDRGDEKQETSRFWIELLGDVLGVEEPTKVIEFEKPVMVDKNQKYIDGYIASTKVLIEQKSSRIKLSNTAVQSDGEKLTPYGQAFRYNSNLPYRERVKWIIVSNFSEILIYDMDKPNGEPESILLKDLEKEYYRLQFLVEEKSELLHREEQISIKAGELVGKLYDAILKQYINPEDKATLHSLNILCVRIVFCLYAEDAGIFGSHQMFHNYIKKVAENDIDDVREALIKLFRVLDTPTDKRSQYLKADLAAFPYVNGGLFADEDIEIPNFTQEITDLLLRKASEDFDWSEISPTIFGAVFESTLNPETRRSGGMHYTSIENIHKVIDPLFLNDLRDEFEEIKSIKVTKTRNEKAEAFREKLSKLTFFDPACGSGNFLTETYISLRSLENEALMLTLGEQIVFDTGDIIKVSIGQFYGIEINDFAVTVAKTALWIAEAQMMKETEKIIHRNLDFLPLKSYANIVEGNALRVDWETIVAKDKLNYIMGNPPFVGKKEQNKAQKQEVIDVFGKKVKGIGNLDYVSCWYRKAVDIMEGTLISTAFVSTNSISQGEQVPILWKELFSLGVNIEFAHRTFRWDSEASVKAHVHCVIIGFSLNRNNNLKKLYDNRNLHLVENINPYLVNAPTVIIENRNKPICCEAPQIFYGSMPIDDGHLILDNTDVDMLLKECSDNKKFIRKYVGGAELIKNKDRWCLWLVGASPKELNKSSIIKERIKLTREFRESSSRPQTLVLADTPTLFGEIRQPNTTMIAIPKVSSENRKYIPISYVSPEVIVNGSALIVPKATQYHFGILTSNVHNAWMRIVCGRMKSDYQYSGSVVYNNFPWPTPTEEQKAKIEQTAQAILDARALYPDCSLADLYDELTMPPELRKAHQANDKAVMQAYGFWGKLNTESECVAELMRMYKELTE